MYLGRNPKYYIISIRDNENNVVYFKLPDSRWKFLHNKYLDYGMWLFNKAFLIYAIGKEKTDNWKFRLVTEYTPCLKIIPFGTPGSFYSRELNFLIETKHSFAIDKTYKHYGSFYEVRGNYGY